MNNRMFLVEKGQFIVIRDGKKEVSFNSFEEFNKYYSDIDLTGKDYIDYEPDRGFYIDNSDSTISINDAPNNIYENIINKIDDIIKNKNDPFFKTNLIQAKDIKKSQIKSKGSNNIYKKWPLFKQINVALGIYDETTKLECITDIKSELNKIESKETEIDNKSTVSQIKTITDE